MKRIMNLFFVSLFAIVSCSSGSTDDIPNPSPPDNPEERTYTFPDDFTNAMVGQEVRLKNEMYVTTTYKTSLSGNVTLSSAMLRIPTDIELPGSEAYKALIEAHIQNQLVLIPDTFRLADENTHTLRAGVVIKNLKGKVSLSGGKFALTITERPLVEGNMRPSVPEVGPCNMKVVSMNLEYYMASPSAWGHSNGAKTEEMFRCQQAKILAAMKAINADVYAICEIEEGDYSVKELTAALNEAVNSTTSKYKYVDSGDNKVTTYTKNVFIYNSEKVTPYKDFKIYDASYLRLRHVAQCFSLKGGEKVILAMNHFKAKTSGTGDNADKGDGQGMSNATRVQEAKDCIMTYENLKAYYGDNDVLVLGDLNSYSMEDPVRVFTAAGYTNELQKYAPRQWSYIYKGEVGYLDHSLSSPTLTQQVTGAFPWDVNASEPSYFEYQYPTYYQPDAYRYSDHNPIITRLQLTK